MTGQPRFPMDLLRESQEYVGGHNGWLDLYGMMSLSKLRFYSRGPEARLIGPDAVRRARPEPREDAPLAPVPPVDRTWGPGSCWPATCSPPRATGWRCGSRSRLRPPFLDEDLVGYTNRLHPRWKLQRLRDKYLLRKVAEKYVPREIAWRRKKMFRAPLDSFHLTGPDRRRGSTRCSARNRCGRPATSTPARWRSIGRRVPHMPRTLKRTTVEMGLVGGDGHAVVAPPVYLRRPGGVAVPDVPAPSWQVLRSVTQVWRSLRRWPEAAAAWMPAADVDWCRPLSPVRSRRPKSRMRNERKAN